jgi:hypothetical protein
MPMPGVSAPGLAGMKNDSGKGKSEMTQNCTEVNDFLQIFKEVFKGRPDIVPKYWRNKEGKSGYSPTCANRYKEGICHFPCRTCPNPSYVPWTDDLLLDHFYGKYILGIYPLLPDGSCWFVAADFDDHGNNGGPPRDPLKDAIDFLAVCEAQGIVCYLERSKSGLGYHVWIFFSEPVPARKARLATFALLRKAGVIGEDQQLSSFDRLFPNQDHPSGKGVGNLIALPFQGKAAEQGHTLLLDPSSEFTKPYEKQTLLLQTIQRATEADLDRIIEAWDLKHDTPQWVTSPSTGDGCDVKKRSAILDCAFVKYCEADPSYVSEPLWYALLSNVARVAGGPSLCHQLSKYHPKYTPEETNAKILQALDRSGPHTCNWIRNNGYNCPRECPVKSPAGLAANEGLDDQESQEAPCYADAILEADQLVDLKIPEKKVFLHPWLSEFCIFLITAKIH